MNRRNPLLMPALLGCVAGAALAYAQPAGEPAAPQTPDADVWQPPAIERGHYDDIVAYNIFDPNRSALAAEAQREPEPELPDDPEPIEPVVELPPPDPDASLVLVGVSIHGPIATAHIEDRATGDIIVLHEPGAFSEGRIEAITARGITYIVGETTRSIHIGQALTGETPEPQTPSATPPAGNAPTPPTAPDGAQPGTPPSSDGLSDLERRMRERRNRE